jgi:RimJ/RimL family protein N-acetyltransferase
VVSGPARRLAPSYPVRTGRLELRPLTSADIDALLTYRGRADVCRFLPFEPMTRARLVERVAGDLGATELAEPGRSLTLGACLADTGQLIGDVVLFYRSAEHAAGELGYVFTPEVSGQGYATEAAAAVLGLAFEVLDLHRVIARLDARNDPSARLAERLGMRREAELRQNEWFKGEWSDEYDYAMLAEEWPDSPAGRLSRSWRSGTSS